MTAAEPGLTEIPWERRMCQGFSPGVVKTETDDCVKYEFSFQPTSTTSVACSSCGGLALRRVGTSPEIPGKVLMIVTCAHCGQVE